MITKEQLRYIFWPWGEVKRLRKAVAKGLVEAASIQVRIQEVEKQLEALKGQQAASTKLPNDLFGRIEELRTQLLESEQENTRLNAEIHRLRALLQQAQQGEEVPPLTNVSHDQ